MRLHRFVLAATLVALLAGACDNGDNGDGADSSASRSTATTTEVGVATTLTSEPDTGDCDLAGFSESDRHAEPQGEVALLTGVDFAGEHCVEAVSFAFDLPAGSQPGWDAGYASGPFTEDASGQPVTVDGEVFLRVVMQSASGVDLSGDEPRETYAGPKRLSPPGGGVMIKEVVEAGDFEATMTWIVGLDARHRYSIDLLDDHLVVSFAPDTP